MEISHTFKIYIVTLRPPYLSLFLITYDHTLLSKVIKTNNFNYVALSKNCDKNILEISSFIKLLLFC